MRFRARGFKTAACLALATAILLPITPATAWLADDSAMEKVAVYNYEGNVTLVRAGKPELVDLDMRCLKDDIYRTGPGESSIDISVPDLIGVRLLEESEIQIVTIQKTAMQFKLSKGTLLIKTSEKLPSGLVIEIDTPTTTATARATQFMARTSGAGEEATAFYAVRKGRIDVFIKKSAAAVMLQEGFALDITPDIYIPNVRNQTEDELNALKQANRVPIMLTDPT